MLDQNTDRMWFVIGAVIVGAAIIFIANTLFPKMFDTIGDTFTAKVTEMSGVIKDILPNKDPSAAPAGIINIFG